MTLGIDFLLAGHQTFFSPEANRLSCLTAYKFVKAIDDSDPFILKKVRDRIKVPDHLSASVQSEIRDWKSFSREEDAHTSLQDHYNLTSSRIEKLKGYMERHVYRGTSCAAAAVVSSVLAGSPLYPLPLAAMAAAGLCGAAYATCRHKLEEQQKHMELWETSACAYFFWKAEELQP